MKVYSNPTAEEKAQIIQRPVIDQSKLVDTVSTVLQQVRSRGDEAVIEYTKQFDGIALNVIEAVDHSKSESQITEQLKKAIDTAAENIRKFHSQQLKQEQVIETMPGVFCSRRSVGIEKVGLYIPGGTAPLFSTVLMLGIPAVIAGCREIVLCTPPQKDGNIHPAVLYAATVAGVTKVFKIGGVQAIGAMAFGTQSVPKVAKIFGPGNQYVTLAKQLVQQYGTAIDMPAGPSEVCVLADETANASFIAADLLSQAEHGADSQVLFITTSESLIADVQKELDTQLAALPRSAFAEKALENSSAVFVSDMNEAMELVNAYAPEHLIIACENADALGEQVINAGSVFLGNLSPESAGDYASGTNHTLPTNGYATAYSGVSVDSFVKKITYQKLTREGLRNIAETVIEMATAEGLEAHANAIKVRLAQL